MTAVTSTGRQHEQQKGVLDFFTDKILNNKNIPLYVKIPLGILCLAVLIFLAWIAMSDKSTF